MQYNYSLKVYYRKTKNENINNLGVEVWKFDVSAADRNSCENFSTWNNKLNNCTIFSGYELEVLFKSY